jgi:hypothetical protein
MSTSGQADPPKFLRHKSSKFKVYLPQNAYWTHVDHTLIGSREETDGTDVGLSLTSLLTLGFMNSQFLSIIQFTMDSKLEPVKGHMIMHSYLAIGMHSYQYLTIVYQ